MPQINKPSSYFNTILYTGNGSTQSITGVGFQPDLIWGKNRSVTGSHNLCDVVRGATKIVYSNLTDAEATDSNSFTSFDSDGFSIGSQSNINGSGNNIVAWNWLAGGTASSNTDGSITSSVSASTTSGFSIVSWTGTSANATVGHGLGSAPKMIIAKNLDSSGASAEHWTVFHHTLDTNKNLYLNLTNAEDTPSPEIYREGSFTNNVFAIGAHDRINKSGEGMIAYCFAEKKGFSKAFSYTGNGSADGSFVYCGFRPAWLMIKRTDSAGYDWLVYDNKRQVSFNVIDDFLNPNSSGAETTGNANQSLDFLSNGIKFRGSGASSNASGGTYIGLAFAESPLVGTNNIPACAR